MNWDFFPLHTGRLEGSRPDDKLLEEYTLLELEGVGKRSGHVGRRDGERHGDEALLQDVVHLEVADHTALPKVENGV